MSQEQYLGEIQSSYRREGAVEFAQNQLVEVFNGFFISLSSEEDRIHAKPNISVQ